MKRLRLFLKHPWVQRVFLWSPILLLAGFIIYLVFEEPIQKFVSDRFYSDMTFQQREAEADKIMLQRLQMLMSEHKYTFSRLIENIAQHHNPELIARSIELFDWDGYGLSYWGIYSPEQKQGKWQLRSLFKPSYNLPCSQSNHVQYQLFCISDFFENSSIVNNMGSLFGSHSPFQFSELIEKVYQQPGTNEPLAFGVYGPALDTDSFQFWQPIWSRDKKHLAFLVLSNDKELFPDY